MLIGLHAKITQLKLSGFQPIRLIRGNLLAGGLWPAAAFLSISLPLPFAASGHLLFPIQLGEELDIKESGNSLQINLSDGPLLKKCRGISGQLQNNSASPAGWRSDSTYRLRGFPSWLMIWANKATACCNTWEWIDSNLDLQTEARRIKHQ